MSKPIPTIQRHMTTAPHSIGSDQPLTRAAALMRDYQVRHLPVLHGGKLVGVLSDRDIKLIEGLRDVDPTKIAVEEAMTGEPYAVAPDTPLNEVAQTMAEKKYGCALVVQNNKVVGIFTTVDCAQALADLLNTRLSR
jgi:acetoin utilization protein AcuB